MERKSDADQPVNPVDRYAAIADEIRSLSQNVVNSLSKVLFELKKSNLGEVYVASKKYLESNGFMLPDGGFIGVADRFVRGRNDEFQVCPADVVIYVMPYTLKTDDVVLTFYLNKGSVGFYHCRVLSFDPRGSIEVYDLVDEKTRWISPKYIFGRLVKVVHFADPEWHELIGQMMTKKQLVDKVPKWIKWLEEDDLPDKMRRRDELERRFALLTEDQP